MMNREDLTEALLGLLPESQHGKVEEIVELIDPDDYVWEVAIPDARVSVETVQAYGVHIKVDTSGNAVSVEFPDGAEVIA